MAKKSRADRLGEIYSRLHVHALPAAPFALRITEHKDVPSPVLVIKERRAREGDGAGERTGQLQDRGRLYGDSLRRLLPIVRQIASKARSDDDMSLEADAFLTKAEMNTPRTLVLDEEAGAKLGVIFKLQERLIHLDRAELVARRVSTFSREEAGYWFSRMTHYGPIANRWAVSGLRILLCGHGPDQDVETMLEKVRARQ